ncbi:MAG TPA: DEAD/DEAH box helicase [Polyangiaceae bacterium]|nr:DEAD/DEAH box helicase [Polyangiaceae bacterium]
MALAVSPTEPLALLHPAVARWFSSRFAAPTSVQVQAWPAAQAGQNVLLAAPTGSGKTLAAFLMAIDALVREGTSGRALPDETRVVYVSPLRALSNDVEKNLLVPLGGIRAALGELGLSDVDLRTAVRTGDTPSRDRAKATHKPPHLYVTTPESLYILLTSESGRRMLSTVRAVIVDEIHALVGDKRGSHLALSLERLAALTGRRVQRIGLSATQKPIEDVARFLVGGTDGAAPDCTIVDTGHVRARDLAIELPNAPLEAVMSGEVWEEVYDRITALVREHKTTLVFVNTRRLCERLAKNLGDRLGQERVTSHHGSLSREHRLLAEQRLKSGALTALVATASLELGIDVGDVDLVVQVGSTRSISAFVQRVGRSGHFLGGTPKGRLFPLSRDELCEAAALLDAVRRGELDRVRIPDAPLDILAQQIVAATAAEGEWSEDALFELFSRAYPYRHLTRKAFDDVVAMLAKGFATERGRRGAHLFEDPVEHKLRPRRGAKLAAITSGGAIPDVADYEVVLEPEAVRVGTIHEDFAIESMAGDVFQLGNQSYVIRKVEPGRVRVEDARGAPPTIPFWLGEAPARTAELSHAVSRLREAVAERLEGDGGPARARAYLEEDVGLSASAAEQISDYFALALATLGAMPTETTLVLERFFDETGGMHLVIHAPLGGRINRAWGLTLRKSFCRKFDFELQAAANEDAIVLSLGPTHSFAVEDVWHYVHSKTARDVLVQALLVAPMFGTRWRWNTQRALAVLRFRGGKKVPPRFQRMDADDLLTVCFPDQVACAENLSGPREVPDHPLVNQTVADATTEAMDADGLVALVERIERGELRLVARDLTEPSPFAANILTAKPYAFLDDAPLEERRTQAVMSRRWLDPAQAKDLGALDPEAIARVSGDAWPDPRDPDELADALGVLGFMTEIEGRRDDLTAHFDALTSRGRATRLDVAGGLWVAADRLAELLAVHPGARMEPVIVARPPRGSEAPTFEAALKELLRSRAEGLGPVTVAELAHSLAVGEDAVTVALASLEADGVVFRGSFRPGGRAEWCERRLLARIHRATIDRLRSEIEPVTQQDFTRFLLAWQRVAPSQKLAGSTGVAAALDILEGFEAPASAWESDLLPARLEEYDAAWLDGLCLAGQTSWLRRTPSGSGATPVRATPVTLVPRSAVARWRALGAGVANQTPLSPDAEAVRAALERGGASFFDDLVRASGLVRTQVEIALGELVSRGLVGSDGFSGLRALLVPANRRGKHEYGRQRGRGPVYALAGAGRWSLLGVTPEPAAELDDDEVEAVAWTLLRRWGVVFRRVIDREGALPPWRELLRCYRRLEARGEIRGGRFVAGFSGEQYALPDAVAALRATRKQPHDHALVAVSAADPLNVVGLLTPGRRVAALAGNRILFRDGIPVAVREGATTRLLSEDAQTPAHELESALIRRRLPPTVRAYLGNAG